MALGKITKFFPSNGFTKKVLRNQIQYLFLTMIIFLIPLFLSFLREFNNYVTSYKSNNLAYPWPEYSDLFKSVLVSIIILTLSFVFGKVFVPVGEKFISKRYKGKDRVFKVHKFVDCVFKGMYYVFASAFGYYTVRNEGFLPPFLGGKGDSSNMFQGYPYQKFNDLDLLKTYLQIQLGYHIYSLIIHIVREAKNDFIEMLLHHLMTVSLVALAYMMNYLSVSALVLLCHDFSDVFGYFMRITVDTDYKKVIIFAYASLLLSWFYMRLIVFPFNVMWCAIYINPIIGDLPGALFLGLMVHFLVVLHAYWFYLFIQMGLKFAKSKVPEDTYHVE
jgi:ceramide synthetase